MLIALVFLGSIVIILENKSEEKSLRNPNHLNLTDEEMKEIYNNTRSLDPGLFDEKTTQETTIAFYGSVPSVGGKEAYEWRIKLERIVDSVQKDKDFQKYLEKNGGTVQYCGSTASGYICISINPQRVNELSQEDLENIQCLVNKYAFKEGIYNVPIVIEEFNGVPLLIGYTSIFDGLTTAFNNIVK
ncbi:hypothetical protein MsAm2_08530 [Methanolapillus ohkumae]|uniref:Uncharacterized protein n=2 Tax=Methanolapillus ohkumae TaxID=3028298 RepID=A0AA97A674_9EURY|nr:hypothetical protein MsAm2_08530 [Methanosarcinaceae archaeon Am2]